ncbi:hypothetical protein ACFPRL_22985 [Pseudoclavibacter helvolus]
MTLTTALHGGHGPYPMVKSEEVLTGVYLIGKRVSREELRLKPTTTPAATESESSASSTSIERATPEGTRRSSASRKTTKSVVR